LFSFLSRDFIVSLLWFGLGCFHVFFAYTFIVHDKPYQQNITELIEDYENIEEEKKKLENFVTCHYEQKIARKNIQDPKKLEFLKSRTLWNIPVKKREAILNQHFYTMLEEGNVPFSTITTIPDHSTQEVLHNDMNVVDRFIQEEINLERVINQ